jgi:pyruvate dehydrogenase E2 component (dihydrolipoamide acetyltransferase)
MASPVSVLVPDLGDFKAVDVVDVLVRVGDVIAVDTPLATLETEKATMDVPSTAAGRVTFVLIKKGDKVSTGTPVVELEPTAAAAAEIDPTVRQPALAASAAPPPRPEPPVAPPPPAAPAAVAQGAPLVPASPLAVRSEPVAGRTPVEEIGFARTHASPSVRLLARELGVDLTQVHGTGAKGRISHDDVKGWVKRALTGPAPGAVAAGSGLPRVPEVDFARFGPVEVQPLTRVQKISGPRLHASWVNLPHVTQFDEADITSLEEVRARLKQKALDAGIKLTPLAFILRACVKVLQQFPRFNASLDARGENLVFKKYLHLGFAADTPTGLVVPVLRDANRKDVYEIARELGALSDKARAGKLTAADMQGGCFTVSSLGGIGGTAFTPIINAPEVAILGVSRSSMKPVYVDGQFVPRLLLPLSLSYDHRVIDGAEAARFTTALAATLADGRGLLEAVVP